MKNVRRRHLKRLRLTLLMACLIGVLLYETQWPMLLPGLWVLLIGQAGAALMLMIRSVLLARDMEKTSVEPDSTSWVPGEERFLNRLHWFESLFQFAGFAWLGYAVWIFTRSLALALAIGLIYPASMYFGVTRKRNLSLIKQLRAEAGQE